MSGAAAGGDTVRLSIAAVEDLAHRVLVAHGCDDLNAAASARNMARSEADGAASHGIFRLPGHVVSLTAGKVNGRSRPVAAREAAGLVSCAGDRGFAPLAHDVGLPVLMDAAREAGVAVLAIRRTHHYAALWPEVETLATAGLAAMAFVSSPPYMAPAGGTRPFFGTNPMAFGWPRPGAAPFVFDQASAALARGDIQIAARDGHRVPEGSGVGPDGMPTTDPAAILAGAQLPFGGYKGSSVALMVDLMAGALIGELSSGGQGDEDNGDGGPATSGETIIAFDPVRLGGSADGGARVLEALAAEVARLPGDRRLENRARTVVEGCRVPISVFEAAEALLP